MCKLMMGKLVGIFRADATFAEYLSSPWVRGQAGKSPSITDVWYKNTSFIKDFNERVLPAAVTDRTTRLPTEPPSKRKIRFRFLPYTDPREAARDAVLEQVERELLKKGAPVLAPVDLDGFRERPGHWVVLIREDPPDGATWAVDPLATTAAAGVYKFFTGPLGHDKRVFDRSLTQPNRLTGFGHYEADGLVMTKA
jgi:hypothetical protein